MKTIYFLILFFCFSFQRQASGDSTVQTPKIQVAILLDISNSMNGLIDQTKAQVWKIANLLSNARKNDKKVSFELALMVYGFSNDAENTVQMLSKFTNEMDAISEQVFGIQTYGGLELCADALNMSLDSLNWTTDTGSYKMVLIAGNESFNQSQLPYDSICNLMVERGIILNTIFCGTEKEGIIFKWQDAAFLGEGEYEYINQDASIKREETPYDDNILKFYNQYKNTFIFIGDSAQFYFERLDKQDRNALMLGKPYFRDRMIFMMQNAPIRHYDLIDIFDENPKKAFNVPKEDLPKQLQELSKQQLLQQLTELSYKRRIYKDAIQIYAEKLDEFYKVTTGEDKPKEATLDTVLEILIREQAEKKGFLFKK